MTASSSEPTTESPKRGFIAAGIAVAAHAVVALAGLLAGRIVGPSEEMRDLAAVVGTVLVGEILTGAACVIVSALQFRRGWRYTGVGLMGGWIIGFLALMALLRA